MPLSTNLFPLHHFAIVFEQLSIALNTLGIFQKSFKIFQQFVRAFRQIFFFCQHCVKTVELFNKWQNYSTF